MKNYWLDRKKNEEIKNLRLQLWNIMRAMISHQGSIIIDWEAIDKLTERLKELEGKNA